MEEQGKFFDMPEEVDLLHWRDYGRKLMGRDFASKRLADRRQWYLGDWLLAGIDKKVFADGKALKQQEFWQEAKKITGYPRGTLKNFIWVAKEFLPSRRRDGVSWSHHREVAKLPVAEQEKYLDRCSPTGKSGGKHLGSLKMLRSEIRGIAKSKNEWDELQARIERSKKGTQLPETFKVTFDGKVCAVLHHLRLVKKGHQTIEEFIGWLVARGLQSMDGWVDEGRAFLKRQQIRNES